MAKTLVRSDTAAVGTLDKIMITHSDVDGMTLEVNGLAAVTDATGTAAFTAALSATSYIGSLSGTSNYINGVMSPLKLNVGTTKTLAEMEAAS